MGAAGALERLQTRIAVGCMHAGLVATHTHTWHDDVDDDDDTHGIGLLFAHPGLHVGPGDRAKLAALFIAMRLPHWIVEGGSAR
jgi:hypothetical protein